MEIGDKVKVAKIIGAGKTLGDLKFVNLVGKVTDVDYSVTGSEFDVYKNEVTFPPDAASKERGIKSISDWFADEELERL